MTASVIVRTRFLNAIRYAHLENGRGGYAVREEIVKFRPDLQDARRRSLFDHLFRNDLNQRLPIGRWYGRLLADVIAALP